MMTKWHLIYTPHSKQTEEIALLFVKFDPTKTDFGKEYLYTHDTRSLCHLDCAILSVHCVYFLFSEK